MDKQKLVKMLVIVVIVTMYIILKVYVSNTPTLKDDFIPDLLLNLVSNDS